MLKKEGKAYLLGAGPGDPDLLTIKAARILRTADVVLYDRLVTAEILALANPSAEFLYAGKHEGEQEAVQEWICSQMAERARQGKTVVRLKGEIRTFSDAARRSGCSSNSRGLTWRWCRASVR